MPGTRPAVDTVMRREEKPAPRFVGGRRVARTTAVVVVQRLAHAHEHEVRDARGAQSACARYTW